MLYIEPKTAVETGLAIYENRKMVLPLLRKVRSLIRHGVINITVFGPGGTGKTTLGVILSKGPSQTRDAKDYEESIVIERSHLHGDSVGRIAVAPGQKPRRQSNWPELYKNLDKGTSRGIINVVSWGYHSFQGAGIWQVEPSKNDMSQDELLKVYVESRRDEELKVMADLVPRLCDTRDKLWMITLVTKQDLWWKERDDVSRFYEEGEYNSCIQQILRSKGEQNFAHEYLSASLVKSNFKSGTGETLALTAEGYDQSLQNANLERLLGAIQAFATR